MKPIVILTLVFLVTTSMLPQSSSKKDITICWDTSYSMRKRDITKDFEVLESVFKPGSDYTVQLLSFDLKIKEFSFEVRDGNWNPLKEHLKNSIYDGATFYSSLGDKIQGERVYLFTDGNKLLKDDRLALPESSIIINSHSGRNIKFLERTALLYRSRLMDFATMLPENITRIGKTSATKPSQPIQLLKGTVYMENIVVPAVAIKILGQTAEYMTDSSGAFELPAEVGDTLVVIKKGTKAIQVPVEVMAHTSIFLEDGSIKLDEVVVTENRDLEPVTVNTAIGRKEKKTIGYAVSTVGDKDINDSEAKLHEALDGKVSGMNIAKSSGWDNRSTLGRTLIRGSNSINMNNYALVVIDGIPVESTNRAAAFGANDLASGGLTVGPNGASQREALFDHINPDNIAEVTVLKGLAATNRFGTLGANGVIMITTKTAVHKDKKGGNKGNSALLKNNQYNEHGYTPDSPFYKALKNSKDETEAYETYLSLRNFNASDSGFFLDAFTYFREVDPEKALRIISTLMEENPEDVTILKTVALCVSSLRNFEAVLALNKELLIRESNNTNALYQNSIAKLKGNRYQEALDNMLDLRQGKSLKSVNANVISKTLDRDIKNLLLRKGDQLDKSNVPSHYSNNVTLGARLVFEWSDPGAQFEIQFVNPQKRFFNWEYTNTSNKQRITNALQKNYALEEFEIYNSDKGKWLINATYRSELREGKIPLVLKCTLYENFGRPNQKERQVILHFEKNNQKKRVAEITIL